MEQLKVNIPSQERLDAYIIRHFPELGIGKLNKFNRENKIKLNGKKVALTQKVSLGDIINLYLPYNNEETTVKTVVNIIYEDDAIIIVNKPAGLPVDNDSDCLINNVRLYFINKPNVVPILCHRIDTGTSGLVIIAKSQEACDEITALLKKHKIEKEYVCVTFGRPQPEKATLKAWLTKNAETGVVRVTDKEAKGSKDIITNYETIAVSGPLALLKVKLVTGRTHQIRAQMTAIDCPLLGDSKYGNNSANRQYRLKYQALCAYQLSFPKIDGDLLSGVSQKTFTAEKPWYYEQIISGKLG